MAEVVSREKLNSAAARWIKGRQSNRLEVRPASLADGLLCLRPATATAIATAPDVPAPARSLLKPPAIG